LLDIVAIRGRSTSASEHEDFMVLRRERSAFVERSSSGVEEMSPQIRMSLQEGTAAANRNKSVQQYRHANEWWSCCWTEEAIRRHPPFRVEFENAIVFASFSEALSFRRNKSGWGKLVCVAPIQPDDFLHPTRITYVLKATSKVRQRWEFRDTFKSILGKDRGLVNDAVRMTKREFVSTVSEEQSRILRSMLHLSPSEFWIASRYGERYGPDGIHRFAEELKERTKGYEFEF
jgi:hypothetical protein